MPRLSIVTINKNNDKGLEKTIKSVWERQTFDNFEHIVIDGASSDNSVDVIRKYEMKITYWISELDEGIYDAMNKGIVKSKGDYLLFLNSGDWLEDDILAQVFNEDFNEDIVYANLYHYRKVDDIELCIYPDKLTLPFILNYSLGHPSTFIKRELFKDMLYEEKYRIISDWVFFIKQILLFNRTTKHLNLAISYFNLYGISSDPKNGNMIIQERSDFFKSGFPHLISDFFYQDHIMLQEKCRAQEQALNILSKCRIQQLLGSVWIQRKARQYIKFLFLLEKIYKKK